MMDQASLQQVVSGIAPQAVFNENTQFTEAVIPAAEIHQVALALRDEEKTQFDFLFNQTGVDLNGSLMVVYHLRSTVHGHSCVLKVTTDDRENPAFDSVYDVWATAEFFEREIFDLFGIRFTNHPDLRRLFLEDDFNGYPLRKDFVDDVNIIEK